VPENHIIQELASFWKGGIGIRKAEFGIRNSKGGRRKSEGGSRKAEKDKPLQAVVLAREASPESYPFRVKDGTPDKPE